MVLCNTRHDTQSVRSNSVTRGNRAPHRSVAPPQAGQDSSGTSVYPTTSRQPTAVQIGTPADLSMAMPKTRFRRCPQVIATRRSAGVGALASPSRGTLTSSSVHACAWRFRAGSRSRGHDSNRWVGHGSFRCQRKSASGNVRWRMRCNLLSCYSNVTCSVTGSNATMRAVVVGEAWPS